MASGGPKESGLERSQLTGPAGPVHLNASSQPDSDSCGVAKTRYRSPAEKFHEQLLEPSSNVTSGATCPFQTR